MKRVICEKVVEVRKRSNRVMTVVLAFDEEEEMRGICGEGLLRKSGF